MQILEHDEIDFEAYMQETDPAERVRPASAYLGEVMHVLNPAFEGKRYP